jgi:outer membrane protein assembly factor BamB
MKHHNIRTANTFLKNTGVFIIPGLFLILAVLLSSGTASAGDWPTHMHDNHRSGTTTEQLSLPLDEHWVRSTSRRPRPSWAETSALQNFWWGWYDQKSRVNVDRAFHVVVVADGLYFGSSNSDKVTCLDARNGVERWRFFSGGPVRFAPTVDSGNVYFGSEDGYVYSLNAEDGSIVWSNKATSSNELMFANGRMASTCPVRTSVLVEAGVAYWGAGTFQGDQTGLDWFLNARNASTGTQVWKISPGNTRRMLGYLLSAGSRLYVPSGRLWPHYYSQATGAYQGLIGGQGGQGGCFALITPDETMAVGPYYGPSGSYINDIAFGAVYGNFLIVNGAYSYYCTDTQLVKVQRSNRQIIWNVSSSYGHALILAGTTLFAGGDDAVAAFSTINGSELWSHSVDGRVHGLAVAGGRLYVSTNRGTIHAFGNAASPGAFNIADFDQDGIVGLSDLTIFSQTWRDCTNPNDADCRDVTQ